MVDLAGVGIRQHDAHGVLVPVELLENDLVGVAGPFHERDVVIARVAGDFQPARLSAGGRDDADPAGGVGFADLGILDRVDAGIKRVGVVDQGKLANARGIELPVGDRLSVRAPAEAVAQAELFLVDPVERAVDQVGRVRVGQLVIRWSRRSST